MSANVAEIRVAMINDAGDVVDLAERVNPRMIDGSLTEKRGGEADELSLTLHNHDGALIVPATGKIITLSLGWARGDDVTPGLIDKGRFRVDELEMSGPPDIVTLRARAADLTGQYRKRRTIAWKSTTLGAIIGEIAARNDVTPRVHPDLASVAVAAIEQNGKSDMAFIRDLGRRHDAVATWKNRHLIFMPVGAATTATGAAIPTITLTRRAGWGWSFKSADRGAHDGAEATWHDADSGQRKTEKTGGKNPKKLKRVYASQSDAQAAAKGAASKGARGQYTFDYDLAFADPALIPNARVRLSGWNSTIDAQQWIVESVETSWGGGGLIQKITLESG